LEGFQDFYPKPKPDSGLGPLKRPAIPRERLNESLASAHPVPEVVCRQADLVEHRARPWEAHAQFAESSTAVELSKQGRLFARTLSRPWGVVPGQPQISQPPCRRVSPTDSVPRGGCTDYIRIPGICACWVKQAGFVSAVLLARALAQILPGSVSSLGTLGCTRCTSPVKLNGHGLYRDGDSSGRGGYPEKL